MRIEALDYELPAGLIAQRPLEQRDAARLLVLERRSGRLDRRQVADLPDLLEPGDLLVVNTSGVRRARVAACKPGGGRVELLLCEPAAGGWMALARGTRLRPGLELVAAADPAMPLELMHRAGNGFWKVRTALDERWLSRHGSVPLPPYIDGEPPDAAERYQPVYAGRPGSAAAPTAGLHFTDALLRRLRDGGVGLATLRLDVGPGTFRKVRAPRVEDHAMAPERYEMPGATQDAVLGARRQRRRIVAVGTSTARALETAFAATPPARTGRSSLFVCPGHRFVAVDGLITNLHLPRTPPLAMVYALAGERAVRRAYREALAAGYRFLSFGDAMLIVP